MKIYRRYFMDLFRDLFTGSIMLYFSFYLWDIPETNAKVAAVLIQISFLVVATYIVVYEPSYVEIINESTLKVKTFIRQVEIPISQITQIKYDLNNFKIYVKNYGFPFGVISIRNNTWKWMGWDPETRRLFSELKSNVDNQIKFTIWS